MKPIRLLPLVLFAAAACFGQETPAQHEVVPAMAVDFVLKNEKPTLHEPLWADLSIVNNGATDVDIDLGANYIDRIRGVITTPGGAKIALQSPYEGGFAAIGKAHIRAHESWVRTYLLQDWYVFPATGRYELVLNFDTLPDPKPLVVDVAARQEKKLQSIYSDLATTAMTGRPAQVRLDAERALSLATDPAAVPSLVKILGSHNDSLFQSGVQGLARIADKPAIEALINATTTGDPSRRQVAAFQLRLARERVKDSTLLKRIDAALSTSVSTH